MIIGIRTHFDAAHYLPYYRGKCKNLHGHRYTVEIEFDGEPNEQTGMIADFTTLKPEVELIVDELDHTLLNDKIENPTAENVALFFYNRLHFKPLRLHTITVYETPDCWVKLINN